MGFFIAKNCGLNYNPHYIWFVTLADFLPYFNVFVFKNNCNCLPLYKRRNIMNPIKNDTKDIDAYFMSLKKMYPKPYNKKTADPYTKTWVILMNGTEYESVWFMHQFARHCNIPEVCDALAIVRKQEQQQQKLISCLKPINESILETTIGYEQLAVDLTACLAINETDKNSRNALNFALLEDFDHLYRFANLLKLEKGGDAKTLVGGYTEIMPGRPTIAEHRYPTQDLKTAMVAKKSKAYTKLVANIITAAEQQTMNYYMNIAQWYKSSLGRKLYAEIAMIEEQHVSQYESLKDPNLTWLEMWVMHEYTECYLYYSALTYEKDKRIRSIWQEFYEQECAHLKLAVKMLEKYDKKTYKDVCEDGEFPELLDFEPNKQYIREVLATTVTETATTKRGYIDISELKDKDIYFKYQDQILDKNEKDEPAHAVIDRTISKFGEDYRYQDKAHPIKELNNRKKDNIVVGRKKY